MEASILLGRGSLNEKERPDEYTEQLGPARGSPVSGLATRPWERSGLRNGNNGEKPPPHFKCYQLGEKEGALNEPVKLTDQFHTENVKVKNPHFLCGPVKKKHCIVHYGKKECYTSQADLEGWHLLCWKIAPSGPSVGEEVTVRESQFEEGTVKVQTGQLLCEPVKKERKKKY